MSSGTPAVGSGSSPGAKLSGALGLIIVLELVGLSACLVSMMSVGDLPAADGRGHLTLLWWAPDVNRPMLFVLLSLLGGAFGGALHSAASITAHVSARDFGREWTLWYLVNPFIGAALATVILFVLQAGLGMQVATGSQSGVYGVTGVAALSGLFSRHALTKLKDVFDVVFASRTTPAAQTGGAVATAPSLTRLDPPSVPAGSRDLTLRLAVTGAPPAPQTLVGAMALPASAATGGVTVVVPAGLLAVPGRVPVRVGAGAVWSDPVELEVQP